MKRVGRVCHGTAEHRVWLLGSPPDQVNGSVCMGPGR